MEVLATTSSYLLFVVTCCNPVIVGCPMTTKRWTMVERVQFAHSVAVCLHVLGKRRKCLYPYDCCLMSARVPINYRCMYPSYSGYYPVPSFITVGCFPIMVGCLPMIVGCVPPIDGCTFTIVGCVSLLFFVHIYH